MRRGFASCGTPLSAKKPPPLTIVASTFSYQCQRSVPPCASIILTSNSFIRCLHHAVAKLRAGVDEHVPQQKQQSSVAVEIGGAVLPIMVILWTSLCRNNGSDGKRQYLYALSADSWTGIFSHGRLVPCRTAVWLQGQGFGDEERARCGYAKFRGRGKAASGPFRPAS